MPLPEDWNGVDWRPTVVDLPGTTMGITTAVLNRDRFPQYGRAYFMMATNRRWAAAHDAVAGGNPNGPVILYNALEVGTAGRLVALFVFCHELGHLYLGHLRTTVVDDRPVSQPQVPGGNRELQADWYSFMYWVDKAEGLAIIEATVAYLGLGGDGDAEHPPPGVRATQLLALLDSRTWHFRIFNDAVTPVDFVRIMLTRMGENPINVILRIGEAERNGHTDLFTQYRYNDAKLRLVEIRQFVAQSGHLLRVEMRHGT